MSYLVGTAGWALPKDHASHFTAPVEGVKSSNLERYASRLTCVEINSSFHRPHRRTTWERWAATAPAQFRFAVKAPKAITHVAKLVDTGGALLDFFNAIHGLGDKLGPVLVQLPPKLAFDAGVAEEFFTTLRELHPGAVVLEPRHPSWLASPADQLLRRFEVARAAADPPKGSMLAAAPAGWAGLAYWRLHGSPRTYYSNYDQDWLQDFAARLRAIEATAVDRQTWVIFDNTALGHATGNAAWLDDELRRTLVSPPSTAEQLQDGKEDVDGVEIDRE